MNIFIPYRFTTLNEYINAERTNKFIASKIKKSETKIAAFYAKKHKNDIKMLKYPLTMLFTWHLKNKKVDPDNISFSKKFILDGLVLAGCIDNDGQNQIKGFCDSFIQANLEGVNVEIIET